MEYVQMARMLQGQLRSSPETLAGIARQNPGALWLIGNEPDVPWQDNTTPEDYATAYHTAYVALKSADPSSRVAIGGITEPSPLRLQYLDRVLAAYRQQFGEEMPIDVWHIHNFLLPEKRDSWGVGIPPGFSEDSGLSYSIEQHDNMDFFRQQIITFRRWMAGRGYRNKELIVSEYGILMPPDYGFDEARVDKFMRATFDYFLTASDDSIGLPADGNRLVQRWCWYSLSDTSYAAGNLFDFETGQMTQLGRDFVAYINSH
jgi:hypothetical protein